MFPLTDAGWQTWERSPPGRNGLDQSAPPRRGERRILRILAKRHAWAAPKPGRPLAFPTTIDEYIDARLAAENVAAGHSCDDHAFIRRIYLDIIGITPTARAGHGLRERHTADKRESA